MASSMSKQDMLPFSAVPTTLPPLWASWINRYRGVDEPSGGVNYDGAVKGVNSKPATVGGFPGSSTHDDNSQIDASMVAWSITGLVTVTGVVASVAVYWARVHRSRVHPNLIRHPHCTAGSPMANVGREGSTPRSGCEVKLN